MIYYKLEPRFHKKTGQPIDPEPVFAGFVCDYTGKRIPCEYSEELPTFHLRAEYSDYIEPVWYYDNEREYFEKRGIDYGSLFSLPYHYESHKHIDESFFLIREWFAAIDTNNKKNPFFNCKSIEEAMRIARIRVVKRLLKEGMKFEELNLTPV